MLSAGTTNDPGLNLDQINYSHLTWPVKHRALSWFYTYHTAEFLPFTSWVRTPSKASDQSVRHKCSLGEDNIQMNLGEKEAISEDKDQHRAQYCAAEVGIVFLLCVYLCNYLLWMS